MFQRQNSINNPEIFQYSDTDLSSIASSESDAEIEFALEINNVESPREFFKKETPKISQRVLSTDKKRINDISNYKSTTKSNEQNSPQIIKNFDSESQKNINGSQDAEDHFKSHSNEIHKTNQAIKNSLLELKKSKDQLIKLLDSNEANGEETVLEKIKTDVNVQIEEEKDPIPVKMNIYQQIAVANFQLDKVQYQLFDFFSGFNFNFGNVESTNKNENSTMFEKASKAKEISDYIQKSHAGTSSPNQESEQTTQKHESFESLCQQVGTIINELDGIQEKLNELLNM